MTTVRYGNAGTIDEVIEQLDDVVDWSIRSRSRIGYFATLYRLVTVQVKAGILTGRFDDGSRMEQLDVRFANRYLTALDSRLQGEPTSRSWAVAFDRSDRPRTLVLQHLLLGINAHINLDLGIASAEVCLGESLTSLHRDFLTINAVLASLVDEVRADIDRISPWIGVLDRLDNKASRAVINFSLEKARDFAWDFAQTLAQITEETERDSLIRRKDGEVAAIGSLVADPPGLLLPGALWLIGLRESRDVARNLDVLAQRQLPPAPAAGGSMAV